MTLTTTERRSTSTARDRQARKLRTQIGIGVVITILAMVATYFMFSKLTEVPILCASLVQPTDGSGTPVSVTIELQGNTASDAAEVAAFVGQQLKTITGDITKSYDVEVKMIANGEVTQLGGCLASSRLVASAESDLAVYTKSSTSAQTRERIGESLKAVRSKQIGWIADAAAEQVRRVDFGDADPAKPVLSPRLAWTTALAADKSNGVIAVFSPLVSTTGDCFANIVVPSVGVGNGPSPASAPATVADSAAQQVKDCLAFNQIGRAQMAKTSIVVASSGLDSAQRQFAEAIARELCLQATPDKCSLTPTGGEAAQ